MAVFFYQGKSSLKALDNVNKCDEVYIVMYDLVVRRKLVFLCDKLSLSYL